MARHGKSLVTKKTFTLRKALTTFVAIAIFYLVVFLGWYGYRRWTAVRLDTVKPGYYHYEFIELRLRTGDPNLRLTWQNSPPHAVVLRNGSPVTTIAGLTEVPLRWDPSQEIFIGKWPCPWNASPGQYFPALVGNEDIRPRLTVVPFEIVRRTPKKLPHRFVVLTMETVKPFATMKVKTPDGQVRDWRGLVDWAKFVGADALWVLGGQTPGDKPGKIWVPENKSPASGVVSADNPNEIWVQTNLRLIPELAKECHRRGIQFGVWEMSYLTMSKKRLPRYHYAMEVHEGHPEYTRAISIKDPNRPQDIIDFLKPFRDDPNVDYLGVDYIRNALGGDELAEDFFSEMPGVRPPAEWSRLSREERIVWFARKRILRKDLEFIDAWQWWRAHRVGLIVHRIKQELGDSKPLWAFTLTWDRGWHHGQDTVMMNDAGIDLDALMLYEADSAQFEYMVKDWHSYVRRGNVQLAVGDVIDWPLHQRSPLGPGEFYYRMTAAAQNIYQDGPAAGIFFHDLDRALWGRLGPYSTLDWMKAAQSAAQAFRSMKDAAGDAGGKPRPARSVSENKPAPPKDITDRMSVPKAQTVP